MNTLRNKHKYTFYSKNHIYSYVSQRDYKILKKIALTFMST